MFNKYFENTVGIIGLPESGKLPKGYQLDHIRERSKHVTKDDFKVVEVFVLGKQKFGDLFTNCDINWTTI